MLTTVTLDKDAERIELCKLREVLLDKPSEIVYFLREDKLYGMVSVGDILWRSIDGWVTINRTFTCMKHRNMLRAKEIFSEKPYVRKIPVIDEEGILCGD